MKNFARLIALCFSLCLLLLWLMVKLGQIAPNQGVIAYTQVDDEQDPRVLLLDVPSGSSLELTSMVGDSTFGRQPQWSHDGQRLSFWVHYNRQTSYAYEMQFNDYKLSNLNERWHYFSLPLYRGNGGRAFANNPMYANSPLYLVEDNSEEVTILLENIISPQFSPDGNYLAYLAFYNPTTAETLSADETADSSFQLDLYTLNLQTGEHINWTLNLATSGTPRWSDDSRYIAFTSRQREVGIVFLLDIEQQTLSRLSSESIALSPPQWSSDGRYLAFVSSRWGNLEIAVFDRQDSSLLNVSNSPSYDVQPTWSPGSRLAFISHRDGQDEIYAYDLVTNQLERLSYSPMNEADPVWRPR